MVLQCIINLCFNISFVIYVILSDGGLCYADPMCLFVHVLRPLYPLQHVPPWLCWGFGWCPLALRPLGEQSSGWPLSAFTVHT